MENPLLRRWSGPYGGVPPFDKVQVALFKPALEAAMSENLSEIDKIAKGSAAPTFENTIVALEKAGQWDTFKPRVTVFKGTVSEVAADLQVGAADAAEIVGLGQAFVDDPWLDDARYGRADQQLGLPPLP